MKKVTKYREIPLLVPPFSKGEESPFLKGVPEVQGGGIFLNSKLLTLN